MMDSFRGRRSIHTLRKLPRANPRRAKANMKRASIGAHCDYLTNGLSTPRHSHLPHPNPLQQVERGLSPSPGGRELEGGGSDKSSPLEGEEKGEGGFVFLILIRETAILSLDLV